MKTRIIICLTTAFLFSACDSKTERKATEGIATDSISAGAGKEIHQPKKEVLANLSVHNFPITDSTNFDNFEKSGMPDTGFLKRVKFDPKRKDAVNFRLNYKIPFSENFTSVVITYQCGEHELFTTLLTVDKNDKIIDKLEIAYDEIAESAFSKASKIEKDKIVVTNSNWMSEEPVIETETYILDKTGKFEKMKN